MYAINLSTGRDLWPPVEVRAPIDGRERAFPLGGLVDAGDVLVGVTQVALVAFDKATGRAAWRMPGQYRQDAPSTAVAGGVLYVQGHPGGMTQRLPEVPGQAGREHRPGPAHERRDELSTRGASPLSRRRCCRADT